MENHLIPSFLLISLKIAARRVGSVFRKTHCIATAHQTPLISVKRFEIVDVLNIFVQMFHLWTVSAIVRQYECYTLVCFIQLIETYEKRQSHRMKYSVLCFNINKHHKWPHRITCCVCVRFQWVTKPELWEKEQIFEREGEPHNKCETTNNRKNRNGRK